MRLKTGMRLRSQVCSVEVIVVRPGAEVDLTCGGHPMVGVKDEPEAGLDLKPDLAGGTQLGKRYVDGANTMEILVTKAGDGTLAAGSAPLQVKDAKPLPSSD